MLAHRAHRTAEITLSGLLLDALSSDGVAVVAARQTVSFGLGSDSPLGLRMTPERTSAFLLLPLLVVGAVMVAVNQFRVPALVGWCACWAWTPATTGATPRSGRWSAWSAAAPRWWSSRGRRRVGGVVSLDVVLGLTRAPPR